VPPAVWSPSDGGQRAMSSPLASALIRDRHQVKLKERDPNSKLRWRGVHNSRDSLTHTS
jgi:hypothetical protein